MKPHPSKRAHPEIEYEWKVRLDFWLDGSKEKSKFQTSILESGRRPLARGNSFPGATGLSCLPFDHQIIERCDDEASHIATDKAIQQAHQTADERY